MLDHVVLSVSDLAASRSFYECALAPLDFHVVKDFPQAVAFGQANKPEFWIRARDPAHSGVHVAFACKERETVDRFYAAALAAGGKDNGPPGVRAHYHPDYYGAFVLDRDGNNIEAVFRGGG